MEFFYAYTPLARTEDTVRKQEDGIAIPLSGERFYLH